ncbi:MAG: hypothetical protein HY617_01455 [Candidatus Sungbacteria bacterium]|nr:hypothetical protein [Candidatus Sungbacteria bacterium]
MNDFKKIKMGLSCLTRNDCYLLENDLSERSITHKLAEYYQVLFRRWDVDCEYNKNLGHAKGITIDPKDLLDRMATNLEQQNSYIQELFQNDLSSEDIRDLKTQLEDPKVDYMEDLDLWVFLLRISKHKIIKKTIFPDIIVHKRGTRSNHIVIEAKKTSNQNPKSRLYDLLKLATLVSDPSYRYKKGIFIELPVRSKFIPPVSFSQRRNSLGVYEYWPK